jgi:hypothetical protein
MKTKSNNRSSGFNIIKKGKEIFYKFYLINPRENISIDALAEKLISFSEVEEVYVTDGAHGFLVKTRFTQGKEPRDLNQFIKKRVDNRYGEMNAYFSYRK